MLQLSKALIESAEKTLSFFESQMLLDGSYGNENLARLKAVTAEKSIVAFSDQVNQSIHSKPSKEYLARQNAPTNMYSGDIETTNSGTANKSQEATLIGQGSNENFANTSSKVETVEAKTISHPE